MSLGLWTYGGATIPDFQTGAIVGTAVGALGGGFAGGFAIALPTALLMTQLDVLGRAVTTVFIHGADHYVEDGNQRGVSTMHLLGQLPWGLTRAIPVFLAVWLGAGPLQSLIQAAPQWFSNGMTTVGHVLPGPGLRALVVNAAVAALLAVPPDWFRIVRVPERTNHWYCDSRHSRWFPGEYDANKECS